MAYNVDAQQALKDLIKSELIVEFGTPEVPSQLEKYSDAVARAIAIFFNGIGGFPNDTDPYP